MDDHVWQGVPAFPTVVSFYGGERYYHAAAENLISDCQRLGITSHIKEMDIAGLEWHEVCRLKVRFCRDMQRRFGRILWVDADNRIISAPKVLVGSNADIAGFVGRRQYIRDYDPYETARFWIPTILYFGDTEKASHFLDAMVELEEGTDSAVTDDWILHETWSQFPMQLNVLLLAPDLIARDGDLRIDNPAFLIGDSGHVAEFRPRVAQHKSRLEDIGLRGQAIAAAAIDAMRAGERSDATVLARYAYRYLPDDGEAAVRLSNYLSVNGDAAHADDILREFTLEHPENGPAWEALVRRLARRRQFDDVAATLETMSVSGSQEVGDMATQLTYEVELDRRAAERGEPMNDRVPVWWSRAPAPSHFSELLKPWIVDRILPSTPKHGVKQRALLLGETGLGQATSESTVWGSGVRRAGESPAPDATYLAVRGPRTRGAILAAGGQCESVYGDPARLLPQVLPLTRPTRRRHFLGLIRSPRDQQVPVKLDGVHDIVQVGQAPRLIEQVADEIVNCHGILTTSLTGLITAHAYGVPARWCVFGKGDLQDVDDGEDFLDYFDSLGIPHQHPLDLSEYKVLGRELARKIPRRVDLPQLDPRYVDVLREYYAHMNAA